MGISLTRQLHAIVYALLCGLGCGVLYDLFRLTRVFLGITEYSQTGLRLYDRPFPLIGMLRRPRSGRIVRAAQFWTVFVGDVLYALIVGCLFSVFLYVAASGCFRWFYLFSIGVGFFAYYFTVGKLVMAVSDMLVCIFRICLRYVLFFLMVPLRFVVKISCRIGRYLSKHMISPIQTRLYTVHCRRYTSQIRNDLIKLIRI